MDFATATSWEEKNDKVEHLIFMGLRIKLIALWLFEYVSLAPPTPFIEDGHITKDMINDKYTISCSKCVQGSPVAPRYVHSQGWAKMAFQFFWHGRNAHES